jgi:hypothetical protein
MQQIGLLRFYTPSTLCGPSNLAAACCRKGVKRTSVKAGSQHCRPTRALGSDGGAHWATLLRCKSTASWFSKERAPLGLTAPTSPLLPAQGRGVLIDHRCDDLEQLRGRSIGLHPFASENAARHRFQVLDVTWTRAAPSELSRSRRSPFNGTNTWLRPMSAPFVACLPPTLT